MIQNDTDNAEQEIDQGDYQPLILYPASEDNIELIVEENAREIGVDAWTIESIERTNGLLYVSVAWGR